MDVKFQFFGFAEHRKTGYGDELAGWMGNLFPAIHLSRDKKRQIFGKFRIEGSPKIIGLFGYNAFKIEFCRPFCFLNQVLVQSASSIIP